MAGRAMMIILAVPFCGHLLSQAEARLQASGPAAGVPVAEAVARSGRIPHDDFREGFIVGYQVVRGVGAAIPAIPAQPATPADRTPFLVGVRMGIEQAGIRLN